MGKVSRRLLEFLIIAYAVTGIIEARLLRSNNLLGLVALTLIVSSDLFGTAIWKGLLR